jgi:hypothetical protein
MLSLKVRMVKHWRVKNGRWACSLQRQNKIIRQIISENIVSAIAKYTIALCPVGKKVRQISWIQKQGGSQVYSLKSAMFWKLTHASVLLSSRKFGKTFSSHLQGTCPRIYRTLKMGLQRCPETSVHKLGNDAEQRSGIARPQLHCGKDLYPHMGAVCQVRSHFVVWNLKCNVNKSKTLQFKKRAGINQNERLFTTKQQERQKI